MKKEMFGFPIKTFKNPKQLIEMMKESKDGGLFLIDMKSIPQPEGDDKVELVWAKIFRTYDVQKKKL